jgi:hypothetical protein
MKGLNEMIVRTFQLQDYIEVSTLLENTISDSCMEKAIASFAKQLYVDSDLILIAQKKSSDSGHHGDDSAKARKMLFNRSRTKPC